MQHKLQKTINKLQGCLLPESGAGLGGIEVVGNGIIAGIELQSGTITTQQAADSGEELIGLTIATAQAGELQLRAAQQGEGGVIQAGGCAAAGVIDAQLTISQRKAGIEHRARLAQRQLTPGGDDNRGGNRKHALLQINMTGKGIAQPGYCCRAQPRLEQGAVTTQKAGNRGGQAVLRSQMEKSAIINSDGGGSHGSPAGKSKGTLCHGGGLGVGIAAAQAQLTGTGLDEPGNQASRNAALVVQITSTASCNQNTAADIKPGIILHGDGGVILTQGEIAAGNGGNGRILCRRICSSQG